MEKIVSTIGNDFNFKVTVQNHEWEKSRGVNKVDKRYVDIEQLSASKLSKKRKREIEKVGDLVSVKKPKISTHGSLTEKLHDHTFTMINRKNNPWMDLIRSGEKTVEGRVNLKAFEKLKVGEKVYFHNRHQGILCKITHLNIYNSFEDMIEVEGVKKLAPHICKSKLNETSWKKNALKLYYSFPGSQRVKNLGALAIGVKYICNYFKGRAVK